jgi:hypothetical protein
MEWNEEVRAGFTMQWVDTEPRSMPNEAPSGTAASLSPPPLSPFPSRMCLHTHQHTHISCVADVYSVR